MAELSIENLWLFRQKFPLPIDTKQANQSKKIKQRRPGIDPRWYQEVSKELDSFMEITMNQCAKRLNFSIERFRETNRWDFVGSVFFSMTVFTTIGILIIDIVLKGILNLDLESYCLFFSLSISRIRR